MAGRMVVLISGKGSNMDALADACERGDVPGDIVAVLADRDCLGLKVAERRGIPFATVAPGDFDSRAAWSAALRDEVAVFEPDLVVSAGFMRILAPVFVDAFAGRLINLHPSLLPSFPGAHAVRDALAAGVRVTGSTVHLVDHEVDHGPILLQEAVRIEAGDDEDRLHDRIKAVEHRLLPEACRIVLEGKVKVVDGRVRIGRS
ncbi:MAG TPA: phosphoribosylglycinamide formyltransferase [Actinomycetota bacterium]|nr:phosphoribosylglycinamide formyltransferase [Actinomycetota bacterium]